MGDIMILLGLLFLAGSLVFPVVWLILLIFKKNRKNVGVAAVICVVGFLITGFAYAELTDPHEETSEVVVEETQTPVLVEQEVEEPVVIVVEEPGSSRSNPIVVTASQFVNEIKTNTDTAKTKYNGKWVQITGKVLSAHNTAGMTSFYLYGEKGGSGLRVVCWVNEEVLKPFDYRGETHTFVGQVREVSTVNSTEISNCKIIE